jgi:hypothetical protein
MAPKPISTFINLETGQPAFAFAAMPCVVMATIRIEIKGYGAGPTKIAITNLAPASAVPNAGLSVSYQTRAPHADLAPA